MKDEQFLQKIHHPMLKSLKHLVLLPRFAGNKADNYLKEWEFIDIDLNKYIPYETHPDTGIVRPTRIEKLQQIYQHGYLAIECAQAYYKNSLFLGPTPASKRCKEVSARFDLPLDRYPEWEETTVYFALPLIREPISKAWAIKYYALHPVMDGINENWDGSGHCHREPVVFTSLSNKPVVISQYL